jgi:hypothetical protein
LGICYPENEFGLPVKISRSTVIGIVKEISSAGFAPEWEKAMLKKLENCSFPSQVLDFYTMGNLTTNDDCGIKPYDTNPAETNRYAETVRALMKAKAGVVDKPIYCLDEKYLYKASTKEFDDEMEISNTTDHAECMEEISLNWTWGMKYLFQRFAIRETWGYQQGESDWHLWPFTQPQINNRDIDVDEFIWSSSNKRTTMMKQMLTTRTTDFESQSAYCTPYTVHKITKMELDSCLGAMVEGTQKGAHGGEFIFKGLAAFKCSTSNADQLFKAFTVSPGRMTLLNFLWCFICILFYTLFLTNTFKGFERADIFQFPSDYSDSKKVLSVLAEIASFLREHFGALATVRDWENFYEYVTITFNQLHELAGTDWNTWEVRPCNFNDLGWKSKVRVLSMHLSGMGDLESQKRTASTTCSMMGIKPPASIKESNIGLGEACKIPLATNPMRSATKRTHYLVQNQACHVPVKIGLLNTPLLHYGGRVQEFLRKFSMKKADAASKAQERSWKDITLSLCTANPLLKAIVPADVSKSWFDQKDEEMVGNKELTKRMDSAKGTYISVWAEECKEVIMQSMYLHHNTNAFEKVMPSGAPNDTYSQFKSNVEKSTANKPIATFSFPHKTIPAPKPVYTLSYLIFLIGPAAAWKSDDNQGLDDLVAVIKGRGKGMFQVEEECYDFNNPLYTQMVSKKIELVYYTCIEQSLTRCCSSLVSLLSNSWFRISSPKPRIYCFGISSPKPRIRVLEFHHLNLEFRVLEFHHLNLEFLFWNCIT